MRADGRYDFRLMSCPPRLLLHKETIAVRGSMAQRHSTVLEGIIAGVLGATVVAVWFFIVDLIARHPLHTPQLLGAALFSILGPGSESAAWYVVTYTIVHYAVFIAVGLIATAVIHAAHRQPAVLAGAF